MANRVPDFDIDLLLTLDALLTERNVTHAASRLNITQPALSGRLTRLRHLLNDPLFVPSSTGRGMVPTPHALALADDLSGLLERLADFASSARSFDPAVTTRIFRIAATDNPAAILAPDLIPAMVKAAPAAKLAFTHPDKSRITEILETGTADVFVGAAEDGSSELICQKLFEEQFVTAQRKGHPRGQNPIDLEEFCRLDHLLISTSGGHFSGMVDAALAESGRERTVSVSVQSYALAPLVLTNSDCICTLPRRFLKRFEQSLDLLEPPIELSPFSVNLFWHPRMRSDPAHIWFRKLIHDVARTSIEA